MKHESVASDRKASLGTDFYKFWIGQTISNLGTSFTLFALPLLIFDLTKSALSLALATATLYLPYLLFGLIIGAYVDRVDRRRLMIYTDVLRAFILVLIPILTVFHFLSVWMIYPIGFFGVTLSIFFDTAQFAVIPSLVGEDQLVTANGRIIASYSVAFVIGPLLAGLLIIVIPLPYLLLFDAVSYVISAYSLTLVRSNFSVSERDKTRTIRQDVYTGLHYVLKNPVLLTVSIMMAIVNFVSNTVPSQIVFFAKEQLHADDAKVGVLYAVGSVGVIIFSLLATRIRKLYPFSKIVLISLLLRGIVTIALAFTSLYWAALPLWAVIIGLNNLFNINTNSLRQAIVPKHLLGRVASIASVIAWSSIPLGNLIGGVLVEETKSIQIVYAAIGAIVIVIACVFFYTPLGHTEKFGV